MSVDWAAHFDAIFASLGVDAVLTLQETGETFSAVRVIDKTADAAVGEFLNLQTVRPVAAVRASELVSRVISFEQLDESQIAFNGKTYRIENHRVKPSPTGESTGQVYLVMTETAA